MPAITLDSMEASGLLAPELSGEIFKKVAQDSAVLKVAGTAPMSITGNRYTIRTTEPEADIVAEGGRKPISGMGIGSKVVSPVKAATIVYWSKEARQANPGGVFNDIQESLSRAIQRQIDQAVLHGRSARSGAVIPGVEYVNQTTKRVTLGTSATTAGGLSTDLVTCYGLVVDDGYEFTGWLADPRLRTQLIGAVDAQGRPIHQAAVDLKAGMDNVLGLPAAYSRSVSGQIGATADQKVRAFGGDFEGNLKVGFVEQITFSRSNEATLIDGDDIVPLWQDNLEAALVEAQFGWVIRDLDAIAAYDVA